MELEKVLRGTLEDRVKVYRQKEGETEGDFIKRVVETADYIMANIRDALGIINAEMQNLQEGRFDVVRPAAVAAAARAISSLAVDLNALGKVLGEWRESRLKARQKEGAPETIVRDILKQWLRKHLETD